MSHSLVRIDRVTLFSANLGAVSRRCEYTMQVDGTITYYSQLAPCLHEGDTVEIDYWVGNRGGVKVDSMKLVGQR